MWAARSIAFRLIVAVSASISCILCATLAFNYFRSRAVLEQQLQDSAHNLMLSSAARVETVLSSVAKSTEALARALETPGLGQDQALQLLRRSLEANPEIYGTAFALEAGPGSRPQAPYFHRDAGAIRAARLEQAYDYAAQDWYQIPRELQRADWSEPYYDRGGGNALMATYSVPVFERSSAGPRLRGVVTSDIALDWLTRTVGAIKLLKTGFAFLVSRNGTMITHPNPELILNETVFSLAEARGDQALREAGRRMIRGESGVIATASFTGAEARVYYAPIAPAGWTLAVVLPERELFSEVRALTVTAGAIGLAGLLLIVAAVVPIARSIARPLRALAGATGEIAAGNFEAELPAGAAGAEVGELTRSFGAMQAALREHIRQLTAATAERQRIESELGIARDIQMAILPPPHALGADPAFSLCARIEPAREVGGDFYDVFKVGDDQLCLLIADVSGKGVPAALFMAVSKTLIKAIALHGGTPAQILGRANDELARDNPQNMFVTVFCALLDLRTGGLTYANAGHNPPLLLRRAGAPEFFAPSRQLVLGAMEGTAYRDQALALAPGDRVLLYTDGVTEAMNAQEELFSEARLLQAAAQLGGLEPDAAGARLAEAVHAFAGGAPQSDDITILLLDYHGKGAST